MPCFLLIAGSSTEIRKQRNEHPPVQLLAAPLLAAQLHGRIHVVVALRRREGHRDARQRAQHLFRRRAGVRRRRRPRRRYGGFSFFPVDLYLYVDGCLDAAQKAGVVTYHLVKRSFIYGKNCEYCNGYYTVLQ